MKLPSRFTETDTTALSTLEPNIVAPLPRARLLRIIRRTPETCPAMTSTEINEAAKRRFRAGPLLAAGALHNMRLAQAPSGATGWKGHDLLTFLGVDSADERMRNMARKRISTTEREATTQAWLGQHAEHGREASGFAALLKAVVGVEEEFDVAYTKPDGRPNLEMLAHLYDTTDAIDHPACTVLPPASSFKDEDKHAAVVKANHLLRYMLLLAQPA